MATVVIDPGHYSGYNSGVCFHYYEGDAMFALAGLLGEALRAKGVNVIYTKTNVQDNPSLEERGNMAANADMFVSLHSDALDNPTVRGVTVYYSLQQPWDESLAVDIGNAVAGAMGNQFREAVTRPYPDDPTLDYYGVIRHAVLAGSPNTMLVEHGFHTNQKDCQILNSYTGLKRIAEAEANVIANYLGLSGIMCHRFRYTTESDDTLYGIGEKFGVPWELIAKANNISSPYWITGGQNIVIPLCH